MKEIIVKAALTLVSHPNPIYCVFSYCDSQQKSQGANKVSKCINEDK